MKKITKKQIADDIAALTLHGLQNEYARWLYRNYKKEKLQRDLNFEIKEDFKRKVNCIENNRVNPGFNGIGCLECINGCPVLSNKYIE